MNDYTDFIAKNCPPVIDILDFIERFKVYSLPFDFIRDMQLEEDYKEYILMRIDLEFEIINKKRKE